jgi:hypothetical protein
MGLLSGQEIALNNGDTIAIKMHLFDTMADDILKLMRGKIYPAQEIERYMHNIVCVCQIQIRHLHDHFMLSVDDIEKLCKSPEVSEVQEEHTVVAEFSAEIKTSLENALHLYRNELDQIPVVIHKNPIFLDTKHDSIKTISLKEYISKHECSHVQLIQKTITKAYVKFSDEFVKEAIEYVSKKLCR